MQNKSFYFHSRDVLVNNRLGNQQLLLSDISVRYSFYNPLFLSSVLACSNAFDQFVSNENFVRYPSFLI